MHGIGSTSRSQWHKVNAHNPRNFSDFLSRASSAPASASVIARSRYFFCNGSEMVTSKRGRREAPMVMLNRNVDRLDIGALNLKLFLDHNSTKTSNSCRMAKD